MRRGDSKKTGERGKATKVPQKSREKESLIEQLGGEIRKEKKPITRLSPKKGAIAERAVTNR